MMTLSTRAKEAIKTALAVVIVYAIALYLGWEKANWGALAVILTAAETAGQTLNKGAMRIMATLMSGSLALLIIALFPQQRWLMIFSQCMVYGFCMYMLTAYKRPYFWFIAGFTAMIIMTSAGPADSLRAFQIAVARVEETALGLLVYTLISVLIWPRSSRNALYQTGRKLSATQHQLFRTNRELMAGEGTAEASQPIRMQQVQLLMGLGMALGAAERDSYDVFEMRRHWQRFHALSTAMMEALEGWRQSFPEIQPLDLTKLLPNREAVGVEVEQRFVQIERMLNGEPPIVMPKSVRLEVDHGALSALTHFQHAALAVTRTHLNQIEALSRSMYDCVSDLNGYTRDAAKSPAKKVSRRPRTIDPERFMAALQVMVTMWIGFLIWIYIDPPKGTTLLQFGGIWALSAAMSRTSPIQLFPQVGFGIVLGSVLYIFVMPHLSSFFGLGLMLFVITFAGFYLLSGGMRSYTVAAPQILFGIQNEQTYDFANMANLSVSLLLAIALAVAITYVVGSPRPEKVFLRRLRRFFRQAELLLSQLAMDRNEPKGLTTRWRMALCRNSLLEIPLKLAALGPHIDYGLLPGQTPDQVQSLANSLQAVAYRLKELVDACKEPQVNLLGAEMIEDMRAWRILAQQQFRLWADDPAQMAVPGADMQDRLWAQISRLEARIGETLHSVEEEQLGEEDYEYFYRYLGACRGLSENGIAYALLAQEIDWGLWKEARF